MKQADIMLNGEGDAWLERNRDRLGLNDPVSDIINDLQIEPETVMEVGCSTGWRLAKLRERYGCKVMGFDPSAKAVDEAARLQVPAWQCTAAALPVQRDATDVLIYGFCLYLTDPADWFRIVAEGDRILRDFGHLIIHDFDADRPHRRVYEHHADMYSYHVDFARFWEANPTYMHVTSQNLGEADGETLTVLRKMGHNAIRTQP